MSDFALTTQDYFKRGWWSVEDVKGLVNIEWITPEEFKEITEEEYKQ